MHISAIYKTIEIISVCVDTVDIYINNGLPEYLKLHLMLKRPTWRKYKFILWCVCLLLADWSAVIYFKIRLGTQEIKINTVNLFKNALMQTCNDNSGK